PSTVEPSSPPTSQAVLPSTPRPAWLVGTCNLPAGTRAAVVGLNDQMSPTALSPAADDPVALAQPSSWVVPTPGAGPAAVGRSPPARWRLPPRLPAAAASSGAGSWPTTEL